MSSKTGLKSLAKLSPTAQPSSQTHVQTLQVDDLNLFSIEFDANLTHVLNFFAL